MVIPLFVNQDLMPMLCMAVIMHTIRANISAIAYLPINSYFY